MSVLNRPLKSISGLTSDRGLTKKAYLNAFASMLDYGARLLVGLLLTPFMVAGLGNYFYGMWQILNRLIGYLGPASGRPTHALKWTLANQQTSADCDQKRRYVASTLLIWVIFLPILAGLGGVVSWFAPSWLKTPAESVWIVRVVASVLLLNMVLETLTAVPQAVLQGENMGYKRMGMSAGLVVAGGGFTWLALYLKTGIIGVAVAAAATTVVTGLFFLLIVRAYAPWFGLERPRREDMREMFGRSWWFMGWNMVMTLLMASDVVVLGLLNSVESVTNYSLTKYIPETLISIIAIIVFGILPGLGGIIGAGNYERAVRLREEIMSLVWLIATALGTTILLWNKVFLGLWVGPGRYSGSWIHLLIVVGTLQLVFIRSDANIIDLTLRLSQKVLIGLLSVTISIGAAAFAVGYLRMGIVGLCLGIMAGRLIMSVSYPFLVCRYLRVPFSSLIRGMARPVLVTVILFSAAAVLDALVPNAAWSGLSGWALFLLSAGLSGMALTFVAFYGGLTNDQRRSIITRIRMVLSPADASGSE